MRPLCWLSGMPLPHAPPSCPSLFYQLPTVEEVTPHSLPGLLLRGKPLAVLLLPSDGLALLASLPPAPPHTTLAWLNQSRYQHILGKHGHVYGNRPPSLVVMDTSEGQVSPPRCLR